MKKIRIGLVLLVLVTLVSCKKENNIVYMDNDGSLFKIEKTSKENVEFIPNDKYDLEFKYTFKQWDKFVENNITKYVANYNKEKLKYDVYFFDYNHNIVLQEIGFVDYENSDFELNFDPNFNFIEWEITYDYTLREIKYIPKYTLTSKSIVFLDFNDELLDYKNIEYFDSDLVYTNIIPKRSSDEKHDYEFNGWLLEKSENELIVYKANYIQFDIKYNITYKDSNDEIIEEYTSIKYDELYDIKIEEPNKIGYIFNGWIEENTNKENEKILVADYIIETFNLPIIEINLDNIDLIDVNRENYVYGLFNMSNVSEEFQMDNVLTEFRGRGNGSWTFDKKGYRIKFDKKQSLFGLEKSKHYALVANGHDKTMLRNNIAYTITNNILDGIEYTTSVNIVDLYINGDYQGVYSLFEHNRVDEYRVDIDEEYGVLDTGYFIEYDAYAEGIEGIDFFRVKGLKYPFTVKSPDPDDYLEETTEEIYISQVNFIQEYMQEVVNSIFSGDLQKFGNLVDLNSVVDMYIIHELFKNTDTGWSSFYMYKKKNDKLFFGPVWDFDSSSGISRGDSSPEGLYVSDSVMNQSAYTSSEIYIELMKNNLFIAMVKHRMLEVSELIKLQIHNYFEYNDLFIQSYVRDSLLWNNNHFYTERKQLNKWLYDRINWLINWSTE